MDGIAAAARIRARRLDGWEAAGLEPDWEGLLARAVGASVFQTLPWQRCWWEAFGAGHELLLIAAYAGARLVGVAPMMIPRATAGGARQVRFVGSGNHAADYCDLIVDPGCPQAVGALLDGMIEAARPWRRIELTHLPAESPNAPLLAGALAARGLRFRTAAGQLAPTRRLGDADADRRAAGKASLRRHTRRLQRAGELRFTGVHEEAAVLGWLETFFRQHVARWDGSATPSLFHDRRQREFYRALVRRLLPRGWLRFDVLLLDGRPLAFHFGFEYRRRFYWYKPSFDPRHAAQSPGEVLIKHLLEDAIGRGLEEFDFTVGAEPFKFRFANEVRRTLRLAAFASAADYWRDGAEGALRSAWRRLRGEPDPGAPPRLTTGAA